MLDFDRDAEAAREVPPWRNAKKNYFPRWAKGLPQEEVLKRLAMPEA